MRLIDADAICSKCNWHDDEHTCDGCSLHSAPTVDVVVRDKGEWVGDSKEECPFCGERSKWFYENFCPACGADMRGEQHDN